MDEEQKEIDLYAEYLNAIARTRLLFNTTDELVAFTGYKPAGTVFSKYGGNNLLKKRSIFEALDATRVKTVDNDYYLKFVLEDYKRASDFYTQFKRHKYFNNNSDSYVELIEYYYGKRRSFSDSQLAAAISKMDKESVTFEDSIIPILILISAGIIPSYWNKKTHDADIDAEYAAMLSLATKIVEKSSEFSMQPIISKFRGQTPENRFYLIRSFEIILITLRQTASPELITQATNSIDFRTFELNGIWKAEEKDDEGKDLYWRFERYSEDLAYFAYRYKVNDSGVWFYDRYEVVFAYGDSSINALFTSSEAIEDMVKYGKILQRHQSILVMEFDDPDSPTLLKFIKNKADRLDGLDIAGTLSLVKDADENNSLMPLIKKAKAFNSDKDYRVYSKAVAITQTDIYFPIPDDNSHYYKVPRTSDSNGLLLEDFYAVQSKSLVALGSGKNLVYYDVTDEAARKKNGIEVVDSIQIGNLN